MIVLRNKNYSGYQPIPGTTYNSAQLRQSVDNGIVRVADNLEGAVKSIEGIHPVIDRASSRWRGRIKGYTRPIKKILSRKKKAEQK